MRAACGRLCADAAVGGALAAANAAVLNEAALRRAAATASPEQGAEGARADPHAGGGAGGGPLQARLAERRPVAGGSGAAAEGPGCDAAPRPASPTSPLAEELAPLLERSGWSAPSEQACAAPAAEPVGRSACRTSGRGIMPLARKAAP